MSLTRVQRRIAKAIKSGKAIVRFCVWSDDDGNEDWNDPRGYYALIVLDPNDPTGLDYVKRVQTRTLLPLRLAGLLNEEWETEAPA